MNEVKTVLKRGEQIDYLTFSGSGEPTLHKGIGTLIDGIKRLTEIPVAVLTNGSLLAMPDVRHDLAGADVVLPTLCSTDQAVFERIHRSHAKLKISNIVEGLIQFRHEFRGEIWLEIMLINGINDESAQINEIKSVIAMINPDKIHLNTVVRPPAEEYAHPVPLKKLEKIKRNLGKKCEIIVDFKPQTKDLRPADELKNIISMIERRPVTIDDIMNTSGLHRHEILKNIGLLLKNGKITMYEHNKKQYYILIRGENA